MTDTKTLLQSADRCRRMAARCANAAIAKKFEALANDYEEHARRAAKGRFNVELSGTGDAKKQPASEAPETIEPSTPGA
jgi:rubrerythrin